MNIIYNNNNEYYSKKVNRIEKPIQYSKKLTFFFLIFFITFSSVFNAFLFMNKGNYVFGIEISGDDTTAPILISCTPNTTTINDGGVVKITIEVEDSESGPDWGQIEWYGPDGHITGYCLSFEGGKPNCSIEIELSKYSRSGNYYMNNLFVIDNAYNDVTYTNPSDFSCNINVNNPNQDIIAPTDIDVLSNVSDIFDGGKVNITFNLEDPSPTGGMHWMQFEWYGPSGHIMGYSQTYSEEDEAQVISKEIEISQYSRNGTYYVGQVSVIDFGLNEKTFNSTTTNGTSGSFTCEIEVRSTNEDFNPPELDSIDVFETETGSNKTWGGDVSIIINCSDDVSGLDWGQFEWESTQMGHIMGYSLTLDGMRDSSNVTISMSNWTSPGWFFISQILLIDKAGNAMTYEIGIHYSYQNVSILKQTLGVPQPLEYSIGGCPLNATDWSGQLLVFMIININNDTTIMIDLLGDIALNAIEKLNNILLAYNFSLENDETFQNATVQFYYNENALPSGVDESALAIYSYNDTVGKWEEIPGVVNTSANYIEVLLFHFSYYAIVFEHQPVIGSYDLWLLWAGIIIVSVISIISLKKRIVKCKY